jgi:hypothetical protein
MSLRCLTSSVRGGGKVDIGMKGGDKLLRLLRDIQSELGQATVVHVGFLEGSTAGYTGPRPMKSRKNYASVSNYKRYHAQAQASQATGNPQPAAYIASIMEYGDPKHNIPSRPFFSTLIKKEGKNWHKFLVTQLQRNHYNSRVALETLGLHVKEQLQDSILHGDWAPLQPGTVARKGFDTPLIDSHNMLNAVDYSVL